MCEHYWAFYNLFLRICNSVYVIVLFCRVEDAVIRYLDRKPAPAPVPAAAPDAPGST